MSANVSKLAHSHMLQLFDKLALHQAWHDNDTDTDTHTHSLSTGLDHRVIYSPDRTH